MAKKKTKKSAGKAAKPGTVRDEEPQDAEAPPEPEQFGDEERAYDPMRGKDVRFDVEHTLPGTSFQGILLGTFVNPKSTFEKESRGYNFIDAMDGKRATVWGSTVLDRLMPQFTPFETFLTIRYEGAVKGSKGNTTKKFTVTASQKGFEKYSKLYADVLDNLDRSDFEWFEDIE